MTDFIRVLGKPLSLACLMLMALSASRALLMALFWNRVEPTGGAGFILLQGLRFDLILAGMLIGPVLLFKPFFHTNRYALAAGRWLWPLYLASIAALVFLVESSTYSFIREYDSRPNFLFVEYLAYPREVLSTLAGSHPAELVLVNGLAIAIFAIVFLWTRRDRAATARVSLLWCLAAFPVVAAAVLMMIRSTLDHRPVNPSIAAFSQDSMVNQLALNSPYTLLYAIYEQRRDNRSGEVRYGSMDGDEPIARVVADAGFDPSAMEPASGPTMHHQVASQRWERPLNIVIILEESLGAEFVGSLGGKDLTPNLDRLASDGIWMEQLYATGTRSVRGIEAVITGFTPTSKRSVVKLMETQDHFFTIARLLRDQGYDTSFIYGGEAHFDNMKRFFLNNGFETITDQRDFDDPVFVATWGASDEDLFNRAHEQFSRAGDTPFFSLVFTSSNHEPFDIPPDRVTPEIGPDGPRDTAVKYADYAFGRFYENAQRSNYWDDTVFLLIADHNSRVYGDQLVPIERFHIPGLIFGGRVEPRRIPGISSQIDMLPTLLSLAGVSADHPGIGHDLTLPEYRQGAGRAMLQFNRIAAYITPGRAVILQPDLPIESFRWQPGGKLEPDGQPDPDLEQTALAYALFGPLMIQRKAYGN